MSVFGRLAWYDGDAAYQLPSTIFLERSSVPAVDGEYGRHHLAFRMCAESDFHYKLAAVM